MFIRHTSAALTINENVDPDVHMDMENIFNRLIRERESYYLHILEGNDDISVHAKSIITRVELTIPISQGRVNLGTWQRIYLCEFRNSGGNRKIVATIVN